MGVPGSISDSAVAPDTIFTTLAASLPLTPERCSKRAKLSPRPKDAVSSMRGRSGLSASATTASLAAMRLPLSLPYPIGISICARASSNSALVGMEGCTA